LVSIPTATYQAYNFYGGMSLYTNQHPERFANHTHAVAVSFLRPYATDGGAGQFLRLDHSGVKWLEAAGYDVGYVSNAYAAVHPDILRRSRLYLSIGHDEYWPDALRAGMEQARDAGVHLMYWSGNTGLWQTRIEATQGVAIGRMVGYKDYWAQDPIYATNPNRVTGMWRNAPVNRPENALLGVMWECCGITPTGWRPWPTPDPLWAGTGYARGSAAPRVVGGEYDKRFNNGAEPAGLQVLAESPVAGATSLLEVSHSTQYRAASGAVVTAMGSISWQEGLGKSGAASADFQSFNANLLNAVDPARGNIHPAAIAFRSVVDEHEWLATTVDTVAGSGARGYGDGPLAAASFNEPRGVALAPGGGLFVADARNGAVRLVKGNSVSTVVTGLRFPNGIAVFPDGLVYVSDPVANSVWEIDPVAKTKRVLAGGRTVSVDGVGADAGFANLNPLIAVPAENVLYALDPPFGVRRIDRTGSVTTVYSTGISAWSVARVAGGYVVSDPDSLKVLGLGVPNPAGNGDYGVRDGAATGGAFTAPAAMVQGDDGSLFVMDLVAGTIRRILAGQLVSVAGNGLGYADGAGASAQFSSPMGLVYDSAARQLFVADAGNQRMRVVQLP
jgi:hypothetical protein